MEEWVKEIGQYTIYEPIFDGDNERVFHKGGWICGRSCEGKVQLVKRKKYAGCYISRAQAWKYWFKYLPHVNRYNLPEVLQEALDEPIVSRGAYYSKKYDCLGWYEG